MTEFAAELELLRAAVRRQIIGSPSDERLTAVLTSVNWQHVLWLGRQHGVLLFVREALRPPATARLCPAKILAQLSMFREVQQLRSLARAREVCRLQDDFDGQGIRAVLIDRWMTAQCIHGRADFVEIGTALPYVISAADRPRAEAMLLAAGHPTRLSLQKLVTLGRAPVLLNRGLGMHPSADRLLAKAVKVDLGGRALDALAPVHQLLPQVRRRPPAADTPLWYHWEVAGIAHSLPAESWPEVLAEAARFGLEVAVVEAVTDSHEALGLPLSPALVAAFGSHLQRSNSRAAIAAPRSPLVSTVPFLPTPAQVMDRMLQLAAPGPSDVVYDLGCGDGRFVVQAARDFGARGVGVDIDPIRIAEAKARASLHGVSDRVSFVCGDVFETNLSEATVLCLYLMPSFFPRIHERLMREGKPGARIVSHDYVFPGWPPKKTEIIRTGPLKISQIYLWCLST